MNGRRLSLFIALRQLWERKLLNSIAVAGVSLGVLVLIGMSGMMQGFQLKFLSEILRVSPHVTLFDKELRDRPRMLEAVYPGPLAAQVRREQPTDRETRIERPRDIIAALERMPVVTGACPTLSGQAVVTFGAKSQGIDLRGIDPATQEACTPLEQFVVEGRWRGLDTSADGAALGLELAEELGARLGDRLTLVAPEGDTYALQVVALFATDLPQLDATRVYVSLANAQLYLDRPNVVGTLEVRLADPEAAPEVAARLERMTGYDAESWQEANANFLSLFEMQNIIIRLVIGAILVVGGFGILAIQIMIVLEKTRDISILRAVGLERRDILRVFLLQGLVVSLVGALFGAVLGWRLLEFLSTLEVRSEGLVKSTTFLVNKDPMYYVWGVTFALLTGLVASLVPAWRASRVEPVEVLRGRGG